jgi:hypothetical protein
MTWLVPLLLGIAIGAAIGAGFAGLMLAPATPQPSSFMRDLSPDDFTGKLLKTDWEVIEDRTYAPFPARSRAKRTARRMIAIGAVPPAEQAAFGMRLQQAFQAKLAAYGVNTQGQFGLYRTSTKIINGTPDRLLLDLPRLYYAIGSTKGVADVGCIASGGTVTVIVSIIEGP